MRDLDARGDAVSAPVDLATMTELSAEITRWHVENLANEQECMRCRDSMHTPSDLDPTPLCNPCAQFVAERLPGMTTAIAALTAERDSLRDHVETQDARIKALDATIAGKVQP